MDRNGRSPAISIVIPVYNTEEVLCETLDGLLAQSFSDFELICVDDGSEDSSLALLEEYAMKDDRVIVLSQKNQGAAVARNNGMSVASGFAIAFFDSDDCYDPSALEKMYSALCSGDADLAVCEVDDLYHGSNRIEPRLRFPDALKNGVYSRQEFGKNLFQTFEAAPFNKLFRRSLVISKGLAFQNINNYNDVFFDNGMLASAEKIAVVKEPLVRYRIKRKGSIQENKSRHPQCPLMAAEQLYSYVVSSCKITDDEIVSLRNDCLRLLVQGVQMAGHSQREMGETCERMRRVARICGIDRMKFRDIQDKGFGFMYWCFMRSTPDGLLWAFRVRWNLRERRTLVGKVRTSMRLLIAATLRK